MAEYTVLITRSAEKKLAKLPDNVATLLERAMLQLEKNPRPPGSKKLKGRKAYRIRQGDYRIIYEVKDKVLTVIVITIGHRRDIYR